MQAIRRKRSLCLGLKKGSVRYDMKNAIEKWVLKFIVFYFRRADVYFFR